MFHWPQMGHKVQHESCKGTVDKGECASRCKLRVTITYRQGLETPDPLMKKGDRGWLLDRQWTVYHYDILSFSSWSTWWWEPDLKIGRLPNRFWFLFPWGQLSGTSEFSKGPFIREIWIWILALSFALVGPRWGESPFSSFICKRGDRDRVASWVTVKTGVLVAWFLASGKQ